MYKPFVANVDRHSQAFGGRGNRLQAFGGRGNRLQAFGGRGNRLQAFGGRRGNEPSGERKVFWKLQKGTP